MSDPTKDDYLFSDKSKFAKELLKNDDYLKCISSISEVKKMYLKQIIQRRNLSLL